jgi:hypothetical protein
MALLVSTDIDCKKTTLFTDYSWQAGYGAIQQSEIYNGELYDANQNRLHGIQPNSYPVAIS